MKEKITRFFAGKPTVYRACGILLVKVLKNNPRRVDNTLTESLLHHYDTPGRQVPIYTGEQNDTTYPDSCFRRRGGVANGKCLCDWPDGCHFFTQSCAVYNP